MKAVEIKAPGGPEMLAVTQRPRPEPREGEVLIRVRAAGVNRPDLLQRQGKYPPPPGITDIPGLEVAGDIVLSRSREWKEGDRVCALLAGGGYAEYAAAPAGQCLPVPGTLSLEEAAALPEAVFTVRRNLFRIGALAAGETALIHGGASGIGTTAIMMAKAAGARVAITAGTDEKCAACLRLGADIAINYKTQDFRTILGENAADIVLDMVGADYLARNLEILRPGGRHVSIAFQTGARAQIDIRQIMTKRLTLTGSTLRPCPPEEKAELRDDIAANVWPQIVSGTLRPVIFDKVPLDRAGLAHEILENGACIGKIVITVP